MDGYWERVEERGKDMSPYRAGFAQTIIVAETDEEAERDYREHIDYFYNRCLHVYPGIRRRARLPHHQNDQGQRHVADDPAGGRHVADLSWQQLIDDGYIIAGSPDTVVEQMKQLISSLRVGNIFCLIHVGNMPQDKCMRSTKLFAEEVMPKLQRHVAGIRRRRPLLDPSHRPRAARAGGGDRRLSVDSSMIEVGRQARAASFASTRGARVPICCSCTARAGC